MNGSPGQLPAAIDPLKLAERGSRLTGTLPLRGMTRLTGLCLDDRGEVEVDLEFGRRERDHRRVMTGRLSARLKLTCPRCLEPAELQLVAKPEIVLLGPGDDEPDEEEGADSMMIEQALDLSQMVEDELLLALPISPAHPGGRCPAGTVTGTTGQGKRSNPFAVLEALKGEPGKGK